MDVVPDSTHYSQELPKVINIILEIWEQRNAEITYFHPRGIEKCSCNLERTAVPLESFPLSSKELPRSRQLGSLPLRQNSRGLCRSGASSTAFEHLETSGALWGKWNNDATPTPNAFHAMFAIDSLVCITGFRMDSTFQIWNWLWRYLSSILSSSSSSLR